MARASARAVKKTKPVKPLLTPRMKECAELMRAGLKTRDIAQRMALSVATVSTYSKRIYAALGLRSRAELQALPMGDGELDKLRSELAAVRKDRDRIKGMYEGLSVDRKDIVTRNIELESAVNLLKCGITEVQALPADDDRETFDKIFGPGATWADGADAREAFVEAMQAARSEGLTRGQGLVDQLALLLSPTDAAELTKAKEDAARVNRLYDTAVDALCRTRADLVALQNELLKLADAWEGSGVVTQQAVRAMAEASQVRARHGGSVAPVQNDVEREVVRLRSAWNLLDTAVSSILTSRTSVWDTDGLRKALELARLYAEGKA